MDTNCLVKKNTYILCKCHGKVLTLELSFSTLISLKFTYSLSSIFSLTHEIVPQNNDLVLVSLS
jgi:hypothetical protein